MRARAHPLASQLVSRGHEVTMFLPPYDNVGDFGREWVQDGVRILNMAGSRSTIRRNGSSPAAWREFPRLLWQLIGKVNRYRPDLIHIFKPKGFAGAAASYFLTRGKRSLVVDCDDWEGWGGWNDVKSYPWLIKEYIDRQERWIMKSAPALTVASRSLQHRAEQIRTPSDAIYYVPNGARSRVCDCTQIQSRADLRHKWGFSDRVNILYSGHFSPDEDVFLFSRAVLKVADKSPLSVAFIGEGPTLPDVKQLFSSKRHVDARFFPQLDYEDFVEVVQAADIAAFPFRDNRVYRAKCSARIVDYMSMGKAVLTSDVGQNREYIVDGESGLLAKPEDEDDFANKLALLVSNQELRRRLGAAARSRIDKHFRWDGEPLQNCLAAYDSVLKKT